MLPARAKLLLPANVDPNRRHAILDTADQHQLPVMCDGFLVVKNRSDCEHAKKKITLADDRVNRGADIRMRV
jgi:hypothetical protein